MAILKWQKGANEWVQLYGSTLRNRLRRDKNLSDLTNATEAKKNLGLYGDVSDHHHDSRYLPMIQTLDGKLSTEIEDRKSNLKSLASEMRTMAESEVSAAIESFGVSISTEAENRKDADDGIRKLHEQDKLALEKEISAESTERQTDKGELISRIDAERSDRTIAIEQEVKDRNEAIQKMAEQIREDNTQFTAAIEKEAAARDAAIEAKASELQGKISQEAYERDKAIAEAKSALTSAIADEAAMRLADRSAADSAIRALSELINQKVVDVVNEMKANLTNYYVGDKPPENPVNGKTVWFSTADGTEEIRIFKNGAWKLFGAGYL